VNLTLTIEPRDYLRAQYLHLRPRPFLCWVGMGFLVVALMAVVSILCKSKWTGADLRSLMGLVISFAVIAFIFFVRMPLLTRRIFRQQKLLHHPIAVHVTRESCHAKFELGESTLPWTTFHKWKENRHLFLVYQSDALFHMWPKRCFPSPEAVNEFRAILESQIGKQGV
jgi:hypothetical protein